MRTLEAVDRFLHNRRARNLRPLSLAWYEDRLLRFAKACPQLPSQAEPIEQFLSSLSCSDATKLGNYRALKVFFQFISQRYQLANPMEEIERPRCPRKVMPTLEPAQMVSILVCSASARDRALLTLLIDNGVRVGEAINLHSQDIGTDTIRVSGKSGEREVPISEETRRQLLSLVEGRGHVFTGPNGPLSRYAVYRIVRRCLERAGISGPKLGPHRLRHSFGKCYLMSGGDLRSLQEIMGHSRISTTEKYLPLAMADTVSKHRQFTPLRSVQSAAQASLFQPDMAVREAEAIVSRKEKPSKDEGTD